MMWMACLCMLTTLIVGCNSGSETQKVAEKFMEAQKNEDVDAMFDLMYFKNDSQKEGMKALLNEKISNKSEGYKKVKSYKSTASGWSTAGNSPYPLPPLSHTGKASEDRNQ